MQTVEIGPKFLNAGPGFGGSCFQKDLLNLIYLCRYYGLEEVANYWEQVILLNEWQKKRISNLIIENFYGTVSLKKIGVLGFAFKSNTNDTRESPAISVIKELLENGANIMIHDPKVTRSQISKLFDEKKIGQEKADQLRSRVADEIRTTFASGYANEISLEGALDVDILKTYARQATGEKYLINPSL